MEVFRGAYAKKAYWCKERGPASLMNESYDANSDKLYLNMITHTYACGKEHTVWASIKQIQRLKINLNAWGSSIKDIIFFAPFPTFYMIGACYTNQKSSARSKDMEILTKSRTWLNG